ncbi:MAG: A24 family peptidase [Propionibacteriaceae bacterium]|jgi:hypothetical protein|nr:A24 family peptidase [Propionibacteriaceae bacterium]
MTTTFMIYVVAAALIGALIGELMRRQLARLSYRRRWEEPDDTIEEIFPASWRTEEPAHNHVSGACALAEERDDIDAAASAPCHRRTATESTRSEESSGDAQASPAASLTGAATGSDQGKSTPEKKYGDAAYPETWEDWDTIDETTLPHPGPRWWVTIATGVAFAALVACFWGPIWPHLALWLPFAAISVWLSAVDLDVRRIPLGVQAILGAWCLGAGIALVATDHANLWSGLISAVVAFAVFFFLNFYNPNGLGLGDVVYMPIIAWSLGIINFVFLIPAVLVSCFLGLLLAAVTNTKHFAFGPYLAVGAVISACCAGLTGVVV